MYGFQRIGHLASAADDSTTQGIPIGGPAGRTALNGSGLPHEARPSAPTHRPNPTK